MFEPIALAQVFNDYGIPATPVVSEEPDLEPHTLELPMGLSVIIGAETCTIVRDTGHGFVDLGESPILGVLVGWVQEQMEEA